MITIKHYVQPDTIEEAYQLLKQKKNAAILGGCAYLRMGSKSVDPAIDLRKLGLNQISVSDDAHRIGASVTFGDLERAELLNNDYHRMLQKSVQDIIGVQFRNLVTVGATVYSRYGFSDLNTALLALGGDVHFASGLQLSLEDYFAHGVDGKDFVTHLQLPRRVDWANFTALRNSFGDYSLLNMAISKTGDQYRIAVGARPQRCQLAYQTMAYMNEHGLNAETLAISAEILSQELTFGSNYLASADYRRLICRSLLETLCEEVLTC